MTRPQFLAKVRILNHRNKEAINELALKALNSGALNLPDYENDFQLARIFMHAALGEQRRQWRSFTAADQKTSNNLELFL